MKCAVCGFEEGAEDNRRKYFIKVLGLVRTEVLEATKEKASKTFYQISNLVACPECKTLRLDYD